MEGYKKVFYILLLFHKSAKGLNKKPKLTFRNDGCFKIGFLNL